MRILVTVALALSLGWCESALAGSTYMASAHVEGYVRGTTTQHVILVDPPVGGYRADTSDVRAGREVFLSGVSWSDTQLVAQASASARGNGNGLRAEFWSSQDVYHPLQFGMSNASATTTLLFSTTVEGAPGTSGLVRLDTRLGAGISPAPFGGMTLSSAATLSAFATLFAQTPGGPACRGDCQAQKAFTARPRDGADLQGFVDDPWSLQIMAKPGDTFTIEMRVSAGGGQGYAGAVWFASPWAGVSPFAAGAGIGSLDAVPQDGATAGPLASLWLSPGLSLAPTDGLVLRPDGSYGFAAPVPEPGAWLLMAGGLLGLAAARKARSGEAPTGGVACRSDAAPLPWSVS
ncbi:PEP-CTERM sorting domain-containing protein [Inhella sp.]|uniref:PEP-CTERM sorting domain-containing protein n=1 Tax=Inhella sp. TaxID=1921806 RepID=UPI0035B32527